MRLLLFFSLLLGLTGLSTATAAGMEINCSRPQSPAIADGRTADRETMLDTMDAVKAFTQANRQYRKCLQDKLESLGDAATPRQKAILQQAFEESVNMEELVADTFNSQLQAFKGRRQTGSN